MYGSPPSYTWVGLPKYKTTGCQMCSGENSVPTWPFHCFDKSILTIDRSPELTAVTPRPSVKNTPDGSILESRAPTTPVALRPVSARHAPAVVPTPCPQFRKNLLQLPNHRPELGFWGRPQSFRNWAQGESVCGQFNKPGLPNIVGNLQATTSSPVDGAFRRESIIQAGAWNGGGDPWRTSFDASRCSSIYGTSDTVMPPSINQPSILYLGRPAQV